MVLNYHQSFDISIAMYCITWIYPLTREQSPPGLSLFKIGNPKLKPSLLGGGGRSEVRSVEIIHGSGQITGIPGYFREI